MLREMTERFRKLIKDYGALALGIYVVLWLVTVGVVTVAIRFGADLKGKLGLMTILATNEIIFIPRVLATGVLTPLVAQWLKHRRPEEQEETTDR